MGREQSTEHAFSFLQYRAAEYEKRYETMQQLEWRLTFQVYAGYAAVAIASSHLHDRLHRSLLVASAAIIATAILYAVFWYVSLRVRERLRYFRKKQNQYIDTLRAMVAIPVPVADRKGLKHQYVWGISAQQVLSLTAFAAIVVYNLARADLIR
jgi:hypothetical protein